MSLRGVDHEGQQTLKQVFDLPPKASWTTLATYRHFLIACMKSQTPMAREVQQSWLNTAIAARGVSVAVEFDADTDEVLDGHHRLRICEELGITDYPRVFRHFDTDEDRLGHIFALNAARRQLVGEAWDLAFAYLLKRRERREITQAQAAKQLGISQNRFSELEQEAMAAAPAVAPTGGTAEDESNIDTDNAFSDETEAEEVSTEPPSEAPWVPRELPPDQRRKVSDEDVITMVTLSAGGLTNARIAEKFDITPNASASSSSSTTRAGATPCSARSACTPARCSRRPSAWTTSPRTSARISSGPSRPRRPHRWASAGPVLANWSRRPSPPRRVPTRPQRQVMSNPTMLAPLRPKGSPCAGCS